MQRKFNRSNIAVLDNAACGENCRVGKSTKRPAEFGNRALALALFWSRWQHRGPIISV